MISLFSGAIYSFRSYTLSPATLNPPNCSQQTTIMSSFIGPFSSTSRINLPASVCSWRYVSCRPAWPLSSLLVVSSHFLRGGRLCKKTCAYTAVKHHHHHPYFMVVKTILRTNNVQPTIMGIKRRLACPYTTLLLLLPLRSSSYTTSNGFQGYNSTATTYRWLVIQA